MRNLFRLEKEIKTVKNKILKDIKYEEENYYKPVSVINFWSNNYIEYEINGVRNKTLSAEERLIKIKPCLKDIIDNLKKSFIWKIQLTIGNRFNACNAFEK